MKWDLLTFIIWARDIPGLANLYIVFLPICNSVYVLRQIRKEYYEDHIDAGPQSRILEGVTYDEARQMQVGIYRYYISQMPRLRNLQCGTPVMYGHFPLSLVLMMMIINNNLPE